jgi:hypothetical protein
MIAPHGPSDIRPHPIPGQIFEADTGAHFDHILDDALMTWFGNGPLRGLGGLAVGYLGVGTAGAEIAFGLASDMRGMSLSFGVVTTMIASAEEAHKLSFKESGRRATSLPKRQLENLRRNQIVRAGLYRRRQRRD